MARTLRMLVRSDLHKVKGIPYSRQHVDRLVRDGKFPPPDGKTADSKNAPNFWWETTIDKWLKNRPPYRAMQREAEPQQQEETNAA
jgi:prophage regulatory protein